MFRAWYKHRRARHLAQSSIKYCHGHLGSKSGAIYATKGRGLVGCYIFEPAIHLTRRINEARTGFSHSHQDGLVRLAAHGNVLNSVSLRRHEVVAGNWRDKLHTLRAWDVETVLFEWSRSCRSMAQDCPKKTKTPPGQKSDQMRAWLQSPIREKQVSG